MQKQNQFFQTLNSIFVSMKLMWRKIYKKYSIETLILFTCILVIRKYIKQKTNKNK